MLARSAPRHCRLAGRSETLGARNRRCRQPPAARWCRSAQMAQRAAEWFRSRSIFCPFSNVLRSAKCFQFVDKAADDAEALRPESRVGGIESERRQQLAVTQRAAG